MERWFGREKGRRASAADEGIARHRVGGDDQYGKRKGSSKLPTHIAYGNRSAAEENESSFEPKSRFFQKASGMPMKMLIEDELLKEREVRRSSPGVIARLMGLDAPLPTSESMHKQETNSCFPKPASFREGHLQLLDQSSQLSGSGQQEFEDVFEVSESSMYGRKKNSLMYKPSDQQKKCMIEKDFINQKKLHATFPSTDEKLQRFRDTYSQREVFDTKGCRFSKFDQENLSWCSKHSEVNSNSVAHLPNHVTILKSLMSKGSGDGRTYCTLERKIERNDLERSVKQCTHKDSSLLNNKPFMGDCVSFSPNSTNSILTQKQGTCAPPTHIVVLKPSLEKDEIAKRDVSSGSRDGSQMSYGNLESRNNGSYKLVLEVKKCQKMPYGFVPLRKKIQCSSELWQENEDITGNSDINDSSETPCSRETELPQSKCSCRNRCQSNVMHTVTCLSGQSDERSNGSHCSNESSVSREARRHLSKQGMISRRALKVGKFDQSSSTLGEMLALSDRENPCKKYIEARRKGDHPLGISSRDGWKNMHPATASGSQSVVASSFCSKAEKPIKPRNDYGSCPGGGEGIMLKDILKLSASNSPQLDGLSQPPYYPCSKSESRKNIRLPDMPLGKEIGYSGNKDATLEQWNMVSSTKNRTSFSKDSDRSFCDPSSSDSGSAVSDAGNMEFASNLDVDRFLEDSVTAQSFEDGNNCSNNKNITAVECMSLVCSQTNSLSNSHNLNTELLAVHKDAEQTSPISVLDTPAEGARLSPDCFQKVNADLHELRLQLRLLKSESESTSTGSEESEAPSDETGSQDAGLHEMQTQEFSTEEEERDFSYVLGILTDSGFQGVSMDMIFSKCYLPETPVDPCIFEKLEKVFDEPEVWSRAERKLLFDLTNSVLAEFLAPNIDLHPWVHSGKIVGHIPRRKVLAEDVWRLLARRRLECSSKAMELFTETDWMDVRGNIDSIGRQIEKMIRDDLFEQLILDLTCR